MALEIANITETMIPEEAAGTATLNAVWKGVAPIPNDASLKDLGSACNASSLNEEIIGMIIIPITIPADSALKLPTPGIILCKKGVTTVSAKNP